jgi:integrase
LADRHFVAAVAAGRLAPGTLDSYRDNCERHIIPHLGTEKLAQLGAVRLRKWLLELQATPSSRQRRTLRDGETELPPPGTLSARTVAYCHAIVRKALNDAVRDELVRRNVALLVEPPVVKRKEIRPPAKDETRKLLAHAAGDRLWAYWLVVLALGLRRGEGLGLRWEHIDFDAGTVRLAASLQRVRGDKDEATGRRKGRLIEKDLKTDASHATLALPASVMTALQEHRAAQAAQRLTAKVWVDPGLVFTTTAGTPLEPRNVSRAWEKICADAGVRRVRIHDLRHAAATYLFAEGVDLKVVQATLRHTRLSTTSDIYTHVLEEVQRGAADSMDTVLGDLTQAKPTTKRTAAKKKGKAA